MSLSPYVIYGGMTTAIGILVVLFFLVRWRHTRVVQRADVRCEVSEMTDGAILAEVANEADVMPRPSRVIFGSPSDPMIEIFLADGDGYRKGDDLQVGPGIIDGLQPLLAQAPTLVNSAVQSLGTSIVVRFAPEIAKGLSNGSLTLMRSLEGGVRSIAVDSSGKIVAHGSLQSVSNLNPATVAVGVWQVLAIVTAQKYLADINKRLAKIESAVEDIKEWLENDRWSMLMANIKYVNSVASRLSNQDITELDVQVVVGELESIERQASHVCEAVRAQLGSLSAKMDQDNISGFGLEEHTKQMKLKIDEYQRQTKTFLAASHLRGHAAQLRAAFPTSRSMALDRISCVSEEALGCRKLLDGFERLVSRRLPELKGGFSFDETDKKCRKEVREHMKSSFRKSRRLAIDLHRTAEDVADRLRIEVQNGRSPVLLALTMAQDGSISKITRLPHDVVPQCGRARSRVLVGEKPIPEDIASHWVASPWTQGREPKR